MNDSKFQTASLLPRMPMFADQVLPGAGKLLLASVVWRTPDRLGDPVSSLSLSFPMCAVKRLHFKLVLQVLCGVPQAEAPGTPPLPASHVGTSSQRWETGPVLNVHSPVTGSPAGRTSTEAGRVLYLETAQ